MAADCPRLIPGTGAGRAITPPSFGDHSCRKATQDRVCKRFSAERFLPKVVTFKRCLPEQDALRYRAGKGCDKRMGVAVLETAGTADWYR